jgi:hypothetical protein
MRAEIPALGSFDMDRGGHYNCAMARNSSRSQIPDISFTAQVWKEGAAYVAYSPELDVSSCGGSLAKARAGLREAVSLFLEECARKGTLEAILAEAGFEKHGRSYRPRRILARAKDRVAVPLAS